MDLQIYNIIQQYDVSLITCTKDLQMILIDGLNTISKQPIKIQNDKLIIYEQSFDMKITSMLTPTTIVIQST